MKSKSQAEIQVEGPWISVVYWISECSGSSSGSATGINESWKKSEQNKTQHFLFM